jgi:hypothetical protein
MPGHAPITAQLDWCAKAHAHQAILELVGEGGLASFFTGVTDSRLMQVGLLAVCTALEDFARLRIVIPASARNTFRRPLI